jgi:hypothetical protein
MGFFVHDRTKLRAVKSAAPPSAVHGRFGLSGRALAIQTSVFTKVARKLRRPLESGERLWLQRWIANNQDYFLTHRRVSRGIAFQLCREMGAKRGRVPDSR